MSEDPSSSSSIIIRDTTGSNQRALTEQGRYPAITHAAVLATVLLPIAFLPYYAARRQLGPLRRKLDTLEKQIRHLRNDLVIVTTNQGATGSQVTLLQTNIDKALEESTMLRNKANLQTQAQLISLNKSIKDVRRLANDAQRSSDAQTDVLNALGMSLADVAAFMQEIERNLGLETPNERLDARGIDRLRSTALRLQSMTSSRADRSLR